MNWRGDPSTAFCRKEECHSRTEYNESIVDSQHGVDFKSRQAHKGRAQAGTRAEQVKRVLNPI